MLEVPAGEKKTEELMFVGEMLFFFSSVFVNSLLLVLLLSSLLCLSYTLHLGPSWTTVTLFMQSLCLPQCILPPVVFDRDFFFQTLSAGRHLSFLCLFCLSELIVLCLSAGSVWLRRWPNFLAKINKVFQSSQELKTPHNLMSAENAVFVVLTILTGSVEDDTSFTQADKHSQWSVAKSILSRHLLIWISMQSVSRLVMQN